MSIALCMVVKNEANRIGGCLDSAVHEVDEINIVDTGSTDGTPELIRQRYGIEVSHGRLERARCYTVTDQANILFERTKCDWILALDADECLNVPSGLLRDATRAAKPAVSGYFGAWRNHVPGQPSFEDYKLFLFRSCHRKRGLVHDNVQIDIRAAGGHAEWLDGLEVNHYPEACKLGYKRQRYLWRLQQAIRLEPDWLRYPWFLGYTHFLAGNHTTAWALLNRLRDGNIELFPVEALNARIVLSEIAAINRDLALAELLVDEMEAFHAAVARDFEVSINFRLPEWIADARAALRSDRIEHVHSYHFAC